MSEVSSFFFFHLTVHIKVKFCFAHCMKISGGKREEGGRGRTACSLIVIHLIFILLMLIA